MKKCSDHWCGTWKGIKIRPSNLQQQKELFKTKVQEFNTTRKPVPHPGFFMIFEYCPDCGEKLNIKFKL